MLGIWMSGCGADVGNTRVVEALPVGDTLKPRIIPLDEEWMRPQAIQNLCDRHLVVVDDRPKGIFRVFRLPGLEPAFEWANQGRGPEEFPSISSFTSMVDGCELLLVHPSLNTLARYTLKEAKFVDHTPQTLAYRQQTQLLNGILRVNDSLYVIDYQITDGANREFAAITLGNKDTLFTFGSYPEPFQGTREARNEIRRRWWSELAAKPDGSKLAAFYSRHDAFRFFDAHGRLLEEVKVTDPYHSDTQRSDDYTYRRLVAATDDLIVVAALNGTADDLDDPAFRMKIEVWDWEGNPLHRFAFDRHFQNFAISEEHQKLYAIPYPPEGELHEYDLSLVFRRDGG